MTDLKPDHPAVQAADAALRAWMADLSDVLPDDMMVYVLAAVLPHLTVDDLRDTPAGKQLMAEGWRAALVQLEALAQTYDEKGDPTMAGDLRFAHGRIARHNPYREGNA